MTNHTDISEVERAECLSYVYIISIDALDLSKVGISDNPASRLRQLSTGSPFKLRLAMSIAVPKREMAVELEKAFHRVVRKYRTQGEWFSLNSTQACFFMAINYACCLRYTADFDDDLIVAIFNESELEEYTCIFDHQPAALQ